MKRTSRSDIYRTQVCVQSHGFTQRLKRPVLKFYISEADQTIPWCLAWELQSLGISEAEVLCSIWESCHWPPGVSRTYWQRTIGLFSGKRPRLLNTPNYPASYKIFLSLVPTTHSNPLSFFILLCVIGSPIWFTYFPLYSIELVSISLPCTTSAFANYSN